MKNLKEAIEKASLRQVSLLVGINYNMMLRAMSAPVAGKIYDPNFKNIDAVEAMIVKKVGVEAYAQIDWSVCEEKIQVDHTNFMKAFQTGTSFTMRKGGKYQVIWMNSDYVVFMETGSTKPQVMSYATFEHQGPKLAK
jgi:hypothetical protein